MSETTEEPVDFRAYLRPIAARKWWIIAIVVAITVATYVKVDSQPRIYEAATSVFIQPSNDAGLFSRADNSVVASLTGLKAAANQAELLQSRQVAIEVKRQLRSPLPADVLRRRIAVSTSRETDFIGIVATGPSEAAAAGLANAYAQAFIQERTNGITQDLRQATQEATAQLAGLKGDSLQTEASRAELTSRLRQLKAAVAAPDGGASQVDSALGGTLVAPFPRRSATFAFVLSLLVSLIGAVVLEGLNRKFARGEQLEEAYGLPILASVPHVSDPSPVVGGRAEMSGGITEPMRTLRVSVNLQSLDAPIKVLLVTSATPGEGKTTVVRNLAMAMAEAGTRVVVIEADLRLPSVAKKLGVASKTGLTDVLLGEASLRDAVVAVDAPSSTMSGGAIHVLAAGSVASNPPAILGSSRMAAVVEKLATHFDVVLIDSPPLLAVSDTLSLLPLAEGIILVGRVKLSNRDAVQRVKDLLSRSPSGRVIGLVVDDVDVSSGSSGYQYGYGYGYGNAHAELTETTDGATNEVTSRR